MVLIYFFLKNRCEKMLRIDEQMSRIDENCKNGRSDSRQSCPCSHPTPSLAALIFFSPRWGHGTGAMEPAVRKALLKAGLTNVSPEVVATLKRALQQQEDAGALATPEKNEKEHNDKKENKDKQETKDKKESKDKEKKANDKKENKNKQEPAQQEDHGKHAKKDRKEKKDKKDKKPKKETGADKEHQSPGGSSSNNSPAGVSLLVASQQSGALAHRAKEHAEDPSESQSTAFPTPQKRLRFSSKTPERTPVKDDRRSHLVSLLGQICTKHGLQIGALLKELGHAQVASLGDMPVAQLESVIAAMVADTDAVQRAKTSQEDIDKRLAAELAKEAAELAKEAQIEKETAELVDDILNDELQKEQQTSPTSSEDECEAAAASKPAKPDPVLEQLAKIQESLVSPATSKAPRQTRTAHRQWKNRRGNKLPKALERVQTSWWPRTSSTVPLTSVSGTRSCGEWTTQRRRRWPSPRRWTTTR